MRVKPWWVPVVGAVAIMAWVGSLYSQTARPPVRYLAQGWTQDDRGRFYTTSQGSQLVPYAWYLALEQPGAVTARFNENSLVRYGYLENQDSKLNPDRLALGFVKDGDTDWLGLTCAACHTNEVDFGGNSWRIDGAPALADTWAFLTTSANRSSRPPPRPTARSSGALRRTCARPRRRRRSAPISTRG